LSLAEKVDRGQMSQADAELELAEAGAQIASEEQRRSNSARAIAAREGVADAAHAASRPQMVSCIRGGWSTTCF
jgi:hypothetical protein